MPYRIEIGPAGSPAVTLDSSDIINVDVAKPHTALADVEAEVPYSRELRNHPLKRVRVYADGDVYFRGYLRELNWGQRDGTTRLSGPGIGDDLRDSATTRTFVKEATHEAIRTIWAEDTGFDATVRQPDVSVIVSDEVVADLTTDSDFQSVVSDDDPVRVNDGVDQVQSAAYGSYASGDGTPPQNVRFGTFELSDPDAVGPLNSNGEADATGLGGQFGNDGDSVQMRFTPEYEWTDIVVAFRYKPEDRTGDGQFNDLPAIDVELDGTQVQGFIDRWGASGSDWEWYRVNVSSSDVSSLPAGESTTLAVVQDRDSDDSYDRIDIDCLYAKDASVDMAGAGFTDSVQTDATGSYNYLPGPGFYADAVDIDFPELGTDFNVVGITLLTDGWNETGGDQAVAVSFDGGLTYFEDANATQIDVDQPSNTGATIDYRVTLDAYGASREDTPATAYRGQSFDSLTVDYDGSDLSIVQDNTFRGSPLSILSDLHDRADYRFVIDHAARDANGDLTKQVESFERGTQSRRKNWSVVDRQPTLSFNAYANEVTIFGARRTDGTRISETVQDDGEVATFGVEPFFEIRPDLVTEDQVKQAALDTLSGKTTERKQTGRVQALPTDILPGYAYPVDWFADGNSVETPLERVTIREGAEQLEATLVFEISDSLTDEVIGQGGRIDKTREGI